ncbi:enoyl-CoA hydratase-related protein [Aneurinibacillus uraniidurans]|uniref:enoyl-CoA hydratase-related protein n=1 Tax=Aneurinibacillus uraniidurans TaxID=2966586 RepID=UPI00234ADC44|nr:enoyl-CoA hydratase-related protein [Aneurinibacillus sp. B1]WCN37180.1 enoyl-CoA hydratase-related protein [Aneurinibacillus sp. B1]
MYETIQYEVINHVATLTLNRPERYNAFTKQMHKEIITALKQAEKDADVRCVVITGAGKAFNAGQDLGEVQSGEPVEFSALLRERYNPMVMQIQNMGKPVIAAVNGAAAGAGMSLALACDLRLAADNAVFSNAFINIGLVPDSGGCYFLPRIVGIGRALELALSGDKLDATEAHRIGMVNQVYPAEQFAERVRAYAERLAVLPTRSIGLIKKAMYKSLHMTLEEALEYEAYSQDIAGNTADHKEGVQAFFEKRVPVFTGK